MCLPSIQWNLRGLTCFAFAQRQIRKQHAVAYLSFEDMMKLELETVMAFQAVLKDLSGALPASKDSKTAYNKTLATIPSRRPNPLYA